MKKIISFFLVFALIFGMMSISFAKDDKSLSNEKINNLIKLEKSKDGKDITITPAKKVTDKENFIKDLEAFKSTELQPSIKTITKSLADTQSVPYSGSSYKTSFGSIVTYDIIEDLRVNGSGSSVWLGSDPFDCDELKHEDTFVITGIGISVSLGSSWGVTGSLTGKTCTWSKTYEDEWYVSHSFSNLDFEGYELVLKEKSRGYFTWGTHTYDVTAVDTIYL